MPSLFLLLAVAAVFDIGNSIYLHQCGVIKAPAQGAVIRYQFIAVPMCPAGLYPASNWDLKTNYYRCDVKGWFSPFKRNLNSLDACTTNSTYSTYPSFLVNMYRYIGDCKTQKGKDDIIAMFERLQFCSPACKRNEIFITCGNV